MSLGSNRNVSEITSEKDALFKKTHSIRDRLSTKNFLFFLVQTKQTKEVKRGRKENLFNLVLLFR